MKLLDETFERLCKGEHVSCETSTWEHPWTNRGNSGKILAHALASIDSAYMVFKRHRADMRMYEPTDDLDTARRDVRALLFRRERLGMEHLPLTRPQLMPIADLEYARGLFANEMPPADAPWDYDQALEKLDAGLAVYHAAHLDPAPPKETFVPTPADFEQLSYVERVMVAHDVISRAVDELKQAPDISDDRSVTYPLDVTLRDAKDIISTIEILTSNREPLRTRSPASAHDDVLGMLVLAWHHATGSSHNKETEPFENAAQREIDDAFHELCRIDHVAPEMSAWDEGDAKGGLSLAQAVLEQEHSADVAVVLRHIEAAQQAERQLAAIVSHRIEVSGAPYLFLRDALDHARVLINSTPPPDHAWDVAAALADVRAAMSVIERSKGFDSNDRKRATVTGYSLVPYVLRLQVARDEITRELAAAEALRGPGPRDALPHARAVRDALDAVLQGQSGSGPISQRARSSTTR